MQVSQLLLWLPLKGLAFMSLIFPKVPKLYLQVESSTAFSKPLPLHNLDQSGISCHKQNLLFLFYTYRFQIGFVVRACALLICDFANHAQ